MDRIAAKIMRRVWGHAGYEGNVWTPHIDNIGGKRPRYVQGDPRLSSQLVTDDLHDGTDWYWTPAVSTGGRKAKHYKPQRVLWVDCDKGYDRKMLKRLQPNFVWETSPGHLQAIWLLEDYIDPVEYHRDGLMGLLAQCVGADPSGVDIGQLLRVPTTTHHKREPYKGRVIRKNATPHTRQGFLRLLYQECGFGVDTSIRMAKDEPDGDRSRLLWRWAKEAAELGLDETLAYKALRCSAWNKWRGRDELLREDVTKAYREASITRVDTTKSHTPVETVELGEALQATADLPTQRLDVVAAQTRPTRWLVPDVIPEMGCGLWIAPPKVGKTRTALEVALGLATGVTPLGVEVHSAIPVAFLSLEDGPELTIERLGDLLNRDHERRYYHWNGYLDEDLVWHPPTRIPLQLGFDAMDLSKQSGILGLQALIEEYQLRLCIIDTLSMAIGKASINDSAEMYNILKRVKRVAKDTGCSIVFIHHTRKRNFESGETLQEKVLGSTALHAWADYVVWLTPPKDKGSVALHFGVQSKRHTHEYLLERNDLVILKDNPNLPDPGDLSRPLGAAEARILRDPVSPRRVTSFPSTRRPISAPVYRGAWPR